MNIKKEFHSETYEEILININNSIYPIIQQKKYTQKKKLQILIQSQKHIDKDECFEELGTFYPAIKNLTDVEFNEDEINILGKSLKFNINIDHKPSIIKEELINLDTVIRNQETEIQDQLRHNFIHELNKCNIKIKNKQQKNKSKNCIRTIKSISKKLTENNATIVKADKGATTVIINKNDYDDKINNFINNKNFTKLNDNPTQNYSKEVNTIINKCKTITQIQKNKLKMINPNAPTLRGQPKTHKVDIPIRPIVNFRRAPTYNLCKFLNHKIKQHLPSTEDYSIRNTCDLVKKIENIEIPDNTFFISFDVVDMYSNIPIKETLNILKHELTNANLMHKKEIEDTMKLTSITTEQNYFQYKSSYFKQQEGLPMGSPLSGLLANIYMNYLEKEKVNNSVNPFKKNIIYWHRYVDDILCLFQGTENECNDFFNYLNTLSASLKFTKEIQPFQINYLDVTISKNHKKHSFKIFRKQTQSELIIPSDSNHPWIHKMSSFHSMINRLLNIPMKNEDFEKEKKIIKYLARKNGYSDKIIDKMIYKNIKKRKSPKQQKEEQKYVCLPHNTILNKAIRKTFNQSTYKTTFSSRTNCFNLINKYTKRQSDHTIDYKKSGIYKLNCSDCDKYYIGQTGRNFEIRYKEHIQAYKSKNLTTMKSNFAEHLIINNHHCENIQNNLKILDYENKGLKMDSKEEFFIYIHSQQDQDKLINTMQTNKKNVIYDKIIELSN